MPISESSLSTERIKELIVDNELKNIGIITYTLTDSTNTQARALAEKEPTLERAVIIAEEQTAGRGRMTRSFSSERGGLYISFLLRPRSSLSDTSLITAASAVKICEAIDRTAGVNTQIKWVNDLILDGKKLGGILTEGKLRSEGNGLEYLVLGVGINVHKRSFPDLGDNIPTTLEDQTGKAADLNLLSARLIESFFSEESTETLMEKYRQRCTVLGKRVTVKPILGEPYPATALTVNEDGTLLVLTEDGEKKSLVSAEVSLSLKQSE